MLTESAAPEPAAAAKLAPSAGAQPETMLTPIPPRFDPYFAWQEEGSLEELDADQPNAVGGAEGEPEGGDADGATDEPAISRLELWRVPPAAARAELIKLLDKHEQEEQKRAVETGKHKITETKKAKSIRIAMQSIFSRDPEFGGGPRLTARPLKDRVDTKLAITNTELASESIATSLAEQMTITDRYVKDMLNTQNEAKTVSNAQMERVKRAVEAELKRGQARELKLRAHQAKEDDRAFLEDLLDEGLAALPESARPALPQRDEDACAIGYMPSAEAASRFMASNPDEQDQDCVFVPEYETLRTQSFVDATLAERDNRQYEKDMGYTPKLREPRTRLAGAKIAAEALCRQCGAPDDKLYRAEFEAEAKLHDEANTQAPELRRPKKGAMMQTISEAYLAEHHRFHSAAQTDAQRLAAVRKALDSVVDEVIKVGAQERTQKLCFCDNPRCIERAGRWPSWVKGCWLMKQHGCWNARAEVVKSECLPATSLRKDRFGTPRYSCFYLLKNDLRVLRLLYALGKINDYDVLVMVQFVLHYSHWVAEREHKALAMGHFMAANCKAFGFSLDHIDPNEFVDRCGELFVDFAADTLRRLITGGKMQTFQDALVGKAARDSGVAPLAPATAPLAIEQIMHNLDNEMRMAFTINLPQPSDVALRVRHWYVSSGTIRPLVNSDHALHTWASVAGMWSTLASLAKQSGNKVNGRTGEHIHILYERDDDTTRSLESVSIVPKEVAQKFGFNARDAMRVMKRIAGRDFDRVQASVSNKGRPSVREQRTDKPGRVAKGRGDFHTTRTQAQCEQRQYLLSEALARRERGWGARHHGLVPEDAAIALQRTILHDKEADTSTSTTQRANEYCPPPHPVLQRELKSYALRLEAQKREEAERRDRERVDAEREAVRAQQREELGAELELELEAMATDQEDEHLQPVREAIEKMDAAFHALLRPDCVRGCNDSRLAWYGGTGDVGDAAFETLLEESDELLPHAGGEDEAEPLLRAFLQALHDLREFGSDYTARWLEHVRDRGELSVDETVRPLKDRDPDRDVVAVVAAATLLQRLVASVANLDFQTEFMTAATDCEVDQTQITATAHDPLRCILTNGARQRRFGATLRQGRPVTYAEGGNSRYGLEHLTAYILERCEHFRQKAEQQACAAALATEIPSTELVEFRLDYTGASAQWTDDADADAGTLTAARRELLSKFFERVVPYAARLHVATTWHTSLAVGRLDVEIATLQTELDAAGSEEASDDAALRKRNAKCKKLEKQHERRSKEREAKKKQHASELVKVARIVRELHMVVADAIQPLAPDAAESESHIRSGSSPLLVAQLAHYQERVADNNKRHSQAWPLKPHAAVVEAPNELVQRTTEHLWGLIRDAGTLTADNAFPEAHEQDQEQVAEMVASVHGAYHADLEDLPTRTHTNKAPDALSQLADRLATHDDKSEHGDAPPAGPGQTDAEAQDQTRAEQSLAEMLHRLRSRREEDAPAEPAIRAPACGEMARVVADQQRGESKKRMSSSELISMMDEDEDEENMTPEEIKAQERSIKRARHQV